MVAELPVDALPVGALPVDALPVGGECLMVCVWESIPHKEISQNDYCGKTRPG